jgi:hypothetical protein
MERMGPRIEKTDHELIEGRPLSWTGRRAV